MKLNAVLSENDAETRTFYRNIIIEYAYSLKNHLRGHHQGTEGFVSIYKVIEGVHLPNFLANLLMKKTNDLYQNKTISGEQLLFLNNEVSSFADICGACERIKNSPIPFSYSVFIKKFIFFYVMTLPFGYVFTLGYMAVPVVVFVFYVLASLELIAEEIENPFGLDANDLPLNHICKNIQKHVCEII